MRCMFWIFQKILLPFFFIIIISIKFFFNIWIEFLKLRTNNGNLARISVYKHVCVCVCVIMKFFFVWPNYIKVYKNGEKKRKWNDLLLQLTIVFVVEKFSIGHTRSMWLFSLIIVCDRLIWNQDTTVVWWKKNFFFVNNNNWLI